MILSVIIPCYNHGQFLQEAVDSVLAYKDQPIEIIIVDDGSTDLLTINKIEELKSKGFPIIQHQNSGLAFSRNVGIEAAVGKYILPLDADNRIKPDYIRKSIEILKSTTYDIIYAKPSFFGSVTEDRKFKSRAFNGKDLFFGNYIDACAVFRKEVWIKNNGYDEKMPFQGVEDWDFWLKSYFNGFKFYFIDDELYEYRIIENSMITKVALLDKDNQTTNYVYGKYGHYIQSQLVEPYSLSKMYLNDMKNPFRSIFKYTYRYFKNLGNKD